MGVQQDDFVGLAAIDLARMAQPDHVLGEVAPPFLPHAGLAHHEGLEALPSEFLQHGGRGDVAVALRAAAVRGLREDGRRHGPYLVIRQGMFRAQHRRVVGETGCKLHGDFS
ncbi:hypothetical protein D3C71_1764550 [compost metagenome]